MFFFPDNKNCAESKTVREYFAKVEREEFCYFLDKEVKKIAGLYRTQLEKLKADIDLLQTEVEQATDGGNVIEEDGGLLQTLLEKYKSIGDEVLELHAYLGVNITALRQILIRYDSLIRTLDGPPLGQWYIVTRREVYVDGDFESIFVRHGLLLLTDMFTFALRNLQSMTVFLNDDSGNTMNEEINAYLQQMISEISSMETVILRAERSVDKALRSRLAITDSIAYSLRYFFLAGSVMNELVMQPSFIRTRGLKLKHEMRFFAHWRADKSEIVSKKKYKGGNSFKVSKKGDIRDLIQASLLLNFMAQFLYMMNHYIIEPSSTQVSGADLRSFTSSSFANNLTWLSLLLL